MAVLFVLQHAEFIGAVQILVYAGGIMVLFLFVDHAGQRHARCPQEQTVHRPGRSSACSWWRCSLSRGHPRSGSRRHGGRADNLDGASAATPAVDSRATVRPSGDRVMGNTEAVGMELYRDYLLPFEVVSIVLLVAMIGAIVMGSATPASEEERPITQEVQTQIGSPYHPLPRALLADPVQRSAWSA